MDILVSLQMVEYIENRMLMKYIQIMIITICLHAYPVCGQELDTKTYKSIIELEEAIKSMESTKLTDEELKKALSDAIKSENPKDIITLFRLELLNPKNVTNEDLKQIYRKFKTQLWGEHHALYIWISFISIAESTNDLYFVNQIEKDILLFKYKANEFPGIVFSGNREHARNSKLYAIMPWFLKHKNDTDFERLYKIVKDAKRPEILRAMVCFFDTPQSKEEKYKLALKLLKCYKDLKELGDSDDYIKEFTEYFDPNDKNFQLKDYYESLSKEKNKLNVKESKLLRELELIYP